MTFRIAVLGSVLYLRQLGRANANADLPDAAALLQQEVSVPRRRTIGSYNEATVMWSDEEFKAMFAAERQGMYGMLADVMRKLKQGGTLKIIVFGGSSTAGANCNQRKLQGKECSWPRRFQQWLEQAFPDGTIELENFAQGAATSSSLLAGASLMLQAYRGSRGAGADIIFVDTLVNDVYQTQKEWSSRSITRNAAIAYEQLLLTLHKLQPHAVIFPVLAGCDICYRNAQFHREVISNYDLAHLDWGEFTARKKHLWDGSDVHPNYWAHQSIADVLATQFSAAWRDYCPFLNADAQHDEGHWPPTYFQQADLDAFQPCLEPLSAYDASIASTAQNVTLGDGWQLYEDRPGKPGWISETPGSRVTFPVRFGEHPVLVLTWMRSYEKMGTATMLLNNRRYQLDGIWSSDFDRLVTLAYTRWLQVDRPTIQTGPEEVGVAGFNIRPWSRMNLTISVNKPRTSESSFEFAKIKVLQVFTC